MKAHLILWLHTIATVFPANTLQWLGCFGVVTLQFMQTRTKTVRANNFYEAVANSILATPAVGALIRATPVLGAVMKYFATPEPPVVKDEAPAVVEAAK